MTQSQNQIEAKPKPSRTIRLGASSQSSRNSYFAGLIVLFILASAIPLGSNRPVFWSLTGFAMALLSVAYFILLRKRGSPFRRRPKTLRHLAIPFAILLGYMVFQILPLGLFFDGMAVLVPNTMLFSNTVNMTPGMGVLSLVQFSTYGLLFFVTLQVAHNTDRAEKMLTALFAGLVLHAIYGIAALTQFGDTILFMEKWAYFETATGTFVNRNSFATFLSFGLIIGVAFCARAFMPNNANIAHKQDVMSGMIYLSGSLIILATLISTQSRMGVFSGGVGAFITVLLVLAKAPRPKTLIALFLIFGISGALVFLSMFGSGLLERIGSTDHSAGIRLALYDQVINMILFRPWAGYGAGSFELVFPFFHQLPVSPDLVWNKAHNTYLTLWSELGLVAGSIPILLVIAIGFSAAKLFRVTKRRWTHGAITMGVIVTAGLHSLADFSLEIHAVAILFVALLALGIAGPSKSKPTDKNT